MRIVKTLFLVMITIIVAIPVVLGVAIYSIPPIPLEQVTVWERSQVVRDRNGGILSMFLSDNEEFCLPVPLDKMGRWVPLVAVQVEDRRFWEHDGVDALGLMRALKDNFLAGRVRSGASTITSQLVRISSPAPRTYATKLREFVQAFKLEKELSKDEILEIYLNRAPFGGNLRGIEAAAWGWYGRGAEDLSLGQAVTLVGMLKGPTAYRPDLNPDVVYRRRNLILNSLVERGVVSKEQAFLAKEEPMPERIMPLPSKAWQFASFMKRNVSDKDLVSSLDARIQDVAEKAVKDGLLAMDPEITGCAVVVDNRTGAVRAYVGNARWGSSQAASWVDCLRARRSPGSALKHFVYAMAFDEGFLMPSSLIADTSLTLAGRAPRNFDMRYRGPVSVASSLVDSLNVPAVRALRMVGHDRFLQKLRDLGFMGFDRNAEFYGDSLILGGCEVTPLELAQATSAFARGGKVLDLSFIEKDVSSGVQVFSPEASWLVTEVLSSAERLNPVLRGELARSGQRMAFKTGTSYGLRDAWTVGWNLDWTIVVWMGNPSGAPNADLVGLRSATPVVVEILRRLTVSPLNYERPLKVEVRDVCSLSGALPSQVCPSVRKGYFVEGVSPSGLCRMHDVINGRLQVIWPKELMSYAADSSMVERAFPEVLVPLSNATYVMHEEGQKLVMRAVGNDVHWFVDGRYLGQSRADGSVLWTMTEGEHRVGIVDSYGRTVTVNFMVRPLVVPVKEVDNLEVLEGF